MSHRVLIIDDEAGIRQALKQVLEYEDLEVRVAASGGEAINLSHMPGTDGLVSWSPDSRGLIFTHAIKDETTSLYLALPDGSDTHPLLDSDGVGMGDWSP